MRPSDAKYSRQLGLQKFRPLQWLPHLIIFSKTGIQHKNWLPVPIGQLHPDNQFYVQVPISDPGFSCF